MTASMSADDAGLGPYIVRIRGWREIMNDDTQFEYEISLQTAEVLIVHLDNAVRALRQRMIVDAACGDCATCQNTRMVTVTKHGRPWQEHCRACEPKREKARARGIDA